jgi:hypothetical protein
MLNQHQRHSLKSGSTFTKPKGSSALAEEPFCCQKPDRQGGQDVQQVSLISLEIG